MEEFFNKLFNDNGIEIIYLEFGKYSITETFDWSIVNYRYDVLNYMCKKMDGNDKLIFLDTDTICVLKLDYLFEELDENLLLYDVQHTKDHIDRKNIINNYTKIYGGKKCNLIHYGEEFIGTNKSNLEKLLRACINVIDKSKNQNGLINFNDEHITSIAV